MNPKTTKILSLLFSLVIILAVVFFLSPEDQRDSITQDIENSKFIILQTVRDPFTGRVVYVAAKNPCLKWQPSEHDSSCSVDCGDSVEDVCYFFEYQFFNQRPKVIATYYGGPDRLVIPTIKFKDQNTVSLGTIENFGPGGIGTDSHYKTHVKELDIKTGIVTTATSTEYYIPYESPL